VTPLGALSVLIGSVLVENSQLDGADHRSAILGVVILKEKLGILGKMGCAMCLLGSILLVLHAPAEREIQTIDEVLDLAMQPRMAESSSLSKKIFC
jgi:magnesium transporter